MSRKEQIAKAEDMGLEFKGNISNDALEELIENAEMAAKEATFEKPTEESKAVTKKAIGETSGKADARKEALRMIKCVVTPLDERMRDMPSEMFSTGNKQLGFIKKVVRFGVETIEPKVILDTLREKKALIQSKSVVNGKQVVTKRLSPAFSIQELEFTEEELASFKK